MDEKLIIDLTRTEGARVLEREHFLYPACNEIIEQIKGMLEKNETQPDTLLEFFTTNIFIEGKRGTGKTSVLLTLEDRLRGREKGLNLEVVAIYDMSVFIEGGVLLYLISYLKRVLLDSNRADTSSPCCSSDTLLEQLQEIEFFLPSFIRCFCDSFCKVLCDKDISFITEMLNHEVVKKLAVFLKKYLEYTRQDALVILLDDIDIIPENKILFKVFLELSTFLNLKEVFIIAAGHRQHLEHRLLLTVSDSYGLSHQKDADVFGSSSKHRMLLLEHLATSLFSKVFPLYYQFPLPTLTPQYLEALSVKISEKKDPLPFHEFIRHHPTFNALYSNRREILYDIFQPLSLREFIPILRNVEVFFNASKREGLSLSDILISRYFIYYYRQRISIVNLLKVDYDDYAIDIEFSKEGTRVKLAKEYLAAAGAWGAAQSLIAFLDALLNEDLLKEYIKHHKEFYWENITDFRNDRAYLFGVLKSIDVRLFSLFYVWTLEMMLYWPTTTFLPLFMTIWDLLYGYPILCDRAIDLWKTKPPKTKSREDDSEDPILLNNPEHLLHQVNNAVNPLDLEEILNFIYPGASIRSSIDLKEFPLSMKITSGRRNYTYYVLFYYKFLYNLFIYEYECVYKCDENIKTTEEDCQECPPLAYYTNLRSIFERTTEVTDNSKRKPSETTSDIASWVKNIRQTLIDHGFIQSKWFDPITIDRHLTAFTKHEKRRL